jgi:hypothetical protein
VPLMVFGQSCQSASRFPLQGKVRMRRPALTDPAFGRQGAVRARSAGPGMISVLVMRCPNRGESVAFVNSTKKVVINPSKIGPWKRLSFSAHRHTENPAVPRCPLR